MNLTFFKSLKFKAGHDHPGYPEEDNVRSCDQSRSGVKVIKAPFPPWHSSSGQPRVASGHKPGRCPSIQHILILFPVVSMSLGGVVDTYQLFCPYLAFPFDTKLVFCAPTIIAGLYTNPEYFPANEGRFFPAFGKKLNMSIANRLFGFLHSWILQEPLLR